MSASRESEPLLNSASTRAADSAEPPKQTPNVPRHSVQGVSPCGVPAYSNHQFEEKPTFKMNKIGNLESGLEWQCVEYARRWLLHRKGLLLPAVHFAAHIIYLKEVYDPFNNLAPVKVHSVFNGGHTPPTADTLIIYPQSSDNFVGHVGVIVDVDEHFVYVADQNRFFHPWEGRGYSEKFAYHKTPDARYVIDDPETKCVGWVTFPGVPNRPPNAPLQLPDSLTNPPELPTSKHLSFFAKGFWAFNSKFQFFLIFSVMLGRYTRLQIKLGLNRFTSMLVGKSYFTESF